MTTSYRIALILGDGIGSEVLSPACAVLDAVGRRGLTFRLVLPAVPHRGRHDERSLGGAFGERSVGLDRIATQRAEKGDDDDASFTSTALSPGHQRMAIIVTGTAVVSGRDASAPEPADPVRPPQIGGPPLTPYWHDGALYVRGVEIETPWRHSTAIEVAGDTVWQELTDNAASIRRGHWSTATGSNQTLHGRHGGSISHQQSSGGYAVWRTTVDPLPSTVEAHPLRDPKGVTDGHRRSAGGPRGSCGRCRASAMSESATSISQ